MAQDTLFMKDGSQKLAYIFKKNEEYVSIRYKVGSEEFSRINLMKISRIAYKNGASNFEPFDRRFSKLKYQYNQDSVAKNVSKALKDSLFGDHQKTSFRLGIGAALPITNVDSSDSLFVNKLAGLFIKAEFDGWLNKNAALSFEAGLFKQNPKLSSFANKFTQPLSNELSKVDFSLNYLFVTVSSLKKFTLFC